MNRLTNTPYPYRVSIRQSRRVTVDRAVADSHPVHSEGESFRLVKLFRNRQTELVRRMRFKLRVRA